MFLTALLAKCTVNDQRSRSQTLRYGAGTSTQPVTTNLHSASTDNAALQTANAEAKAVLSKGGMTVPSTIGKELETNPFMRADQPAVQKAVGLGPDADVGDVLQKVRDLKDRF